MAIKDDTVRVLQLIDHDAQFFYNQNQAGSDPVILNKYDLSNPEFVGSVSQRIFSDGSGADFVAKCHCGATEGNNKTGMICPICETEVLTTHLLDDNNLVCRNWLSCPSELKHGWIAPKIYLNLASWLSYDKGKRNYLDDILDVDAIVPHDLRDVITGQGFHYFYENFDRILDYFIHSHPVISKKPDTAAMRFCLQLNRERIFCHYIPILNSAINPIMGIEGAVTSNRRYSDITADYVIKAAISLSRLEFAPKKRNRRQHVERVAYKAFKDLIAYVEEATRKYISTKKAIPRTHIFGSRFHLSFRAVVVPIIGQHNYYDLHVPWRMAVNTLRVPILGILCREYKIPMNEAVSRVRQALQVIDPLIKEIMDRMIEDSPFPGIPCVWDRPPSIRDGSVRLVYWTKIKPNLDDSCVGMTPLDVALPNADFDGDNLAGVIIPEVEMVNAFRSLSSASLIFNRNTGEVSNEIGIHKTNAITWNSFLGNV